MDQFEVAYQLRELAFLLEFQDERLFRSIAYMKAAKAIEELENFESLIKKRELKTIPGIGNEISKMAHRMIEKGELVNTFSLPKMKRFLHNVRAH